MNKIILLFVVALMTIGLNAGNPNYQELTKQGMDSYYSGHFAQAQQYFKKSLEMRRKQFGPDSKQAAEGLRSLAWLALETEQFSLIDKYISESLKIERNKFGVDSPEVAESNTIYAIVFFIQGKYDDARKLLENAVKIIKAKYGEDSECASKADYQLAELYQELGLYAAAERIIKQNLKLQAKKIPNSIQTLQWKKLYARFLSRDNPQSALKIVDNEILPGFEPLGAQSPLRRQALYVKFSILKKLGRKEAAAKLFKQQEILVDKLYGPKSVNAAFLLKAKSDDLCTAHDYRGALELAVKGEKIVADKVGAKHLWTYHFVIWRGLLYLRQWQEKNAEPLITANYNFIEANLPLNSALYGRALFQMGELYMQQKKYDLAEKELKAALPVFHKQFGKKSIWLALCYNDLAINASRQKRFEEAVWLTEKMKNMYLDVYGKDHVFTAQAWSNLGYAYSRFHKYAQALVAFQEALRILRLKFGDDHIRVARAYAILARAYQFKNEYDNAMEACSKALAICEKIKPQDNPALSDIYYMCALCFSYKNKKLPRAIELLEKAISIREKSYGANDNGVLFYKRYLQRLKAK